MSARVRHKSRTASSSGLGMPTPTSSPARDRRGEPAAVPPVGLGPCHQVPEGAATARSPRSARPCCAAAGQLQTGGAGLVAGSQPPGIIEPADAPADRRLVVGDPLRVGDLPVRTQDPNRDGVVMNVQPQVDGQTRETLATAGSFRMVAPPASVWVTHADADRSRPLHAD
jgi:hypothetical protein